MRTPAGHQRTVDASIGPPAEIPEACAFDAPVAVFTEILFCVTIATLPSLLCRYINSGCLALRRILVLSYAHKPQTLERRRDRRCTRCFPERAWIEIAEFPRSALTS
jgi:hypothetical protein